MESILITTNAQITDQTLQENVENNFHQDENTEIRVEVVEQLEDEAVNVLPEDFRCLLTHFEEPEEFVADFLSRIEGPAADERHYGDVDVYCKGWERTCDRLSLLKHVLKSLPTIT